MKVYKESEWLNKEADEGYSIGIGGVVIKNSVIVSLSVNQRKGGLTCHSIWYSKPGKRDYRLEENGTVSLVEESAEKVISKVKPSNIVIKNKKVIPFSKWFEDYVPVYNRRYSHEKFPVKAITIDGLKINMDGTPYCMKVTHNHGIFKIDDVSVDPCDILVFNYGIVRDICDDWLKHAYFSENYDLVFDADGQYHYNSGYNCDYFGEEKCGLESIGLKVLTNNNK